MKKLFVALLLTSLLLFTPISAQEFVDIPLLGATAVDDVSLLLATVLIAAADGFNPCSIWVLLFLLGMIIHTNSRKKILLVGGVFLFTTAAMYGLFILGIFTIFTFINQLTSIIYGVAVLAFIFGLVNIKDYFFYGKGLSFSIPDSVKPRLFKKTRALIKQENLFFLLFSTFLLSLGVAIIELPCTAGLPLIWSGIILSSAQANFYAYLLVYLFVYLLIEILILVVVLITLRTIKMDEFKGRALKLIGGVLITALAIVLLVDRTLMNDIGTALLIVLGSLLLSLLIIVLDVFLRRRREAKP